MKVEMKKKSQKELYIFNITCDIINIFQARYSKHKTIIEKKEDTLIELKYNLKKK